MILLTGLPTADCFAPVAVGLQLFDQRRGTRQQWLPCYLRDAALFYRRLKEVSAGVSAKQLDVLDAIILHNHLVNCSVQADIVTAVRKQEGTYESIQ